HSIIRTPEQVDLTELRKDFEQEIVSIYPLDLRHQRQQQVPGCILVGGIRQVTRPFEFVGDRHGCIISPIAGPGFNPKRRTCAACPPVRVTADQLHVTLMLKSLVIIPAIGFFMSAP
ncbi:MAG: hypothetical protein QOD58_432, partial [Mycobacterium sp.]|nr:hypothetical protein [Mycobacterium sp.]